MSQDGVSAPMAGGDPTRRNVLLLCGAMALSNTGASLIMTVTALTGAMLADPSVFYYIPFIGDVAETKFPTLALGVQFIGTMATTVPAALLMRRVGRRIGFTMGQGIGFCGALLAAYAIQANSFWLFVLAGGLIGSHNAFWAQYRFAAADTASADYKPRAITYVMAGPILAGIFGPELAKYSRTLMEPLLFAGSYLTVAVLCLITMSVLQFIRIPRPAARGQGNAGRPLREILSSERGIWVAIIAAMIGYASMSFLMTATPLAIIACDHQFEDAAFVIQWHVIAMFGPSFVTGRLIQRFGGRVIVTTGAMLFLTAIAVNMTGVEILQFWASLVLVGIGWNFMFVGGTTMLTDCYRPEEKEKVQGFNDLMVFGTVAIASLMSGALQQAFGWTVVNLAVAVPILFALLTVIISAGRSGLSDGIAK